MPPVPNQPSFDDPELRFSSSLVFFVNGKKVTPLMLIIIVMTMVVIMIMMIRDRVGIFAFVDGKKVTCSMQLMSNEKVVFLPQTIVKPTTCQVIEENPDPATTLLTFLR